MPQACTVAAASLCVSSKTLTKVINNLPDSVVRRILKKKEKKNSTDDHFAQQLASSSVAIPTYAFKIIKKCGIKHGGRLNFVPGYI